jgi:hypothetical protein
VSIAKLQKIKEAIEGVVRQPLVTNAMRQAWAEQLGEVITELRAAEDAEEEDDDLDEEDEEDEDDETVDECYLNELAVDRVARALDRPRWQVEDDPEGAIDDLCRKVRK